ncbi:MAG: methyltransferase domain-containing protein [Pseudonocardiaceae bacterium]
MTPTPSTSLAGLVDLLTADAALPEQWREAFLVVPREVFIPEVIWRDDGDDLVPLSRSEDPDEWLRRVYGLRYVIIQVDDGVPAGCGKLGRVATSSASRPDIVALMLGAGQIEPGMRVLEIGTGTGYTAALLAHRLGARNVTTIEVNPDLAARARAALTTAGYDEVTVITDDGARGYHKRAPFDRVMSTAAVFRVPYAWVAQTRPGGMVVTPWSSTYKPAGLLSLTVGEDGIATGGLVNKTISFMSLRDQRVHLTTVADVVRDTDIPDVSDTRLHAHHVCKGDARFAIGWRVPGCQWEYVPATDNDGRWCVWFLDSGSRSWAHFDYQPGIRRWPVHQFGPRRLWDEVEAAYHWWEQAGKPPAEQWQFTVAPYGQHIDLPDSCITNEDGHWRDTDVVNRL